MRLTLFSLGACVLFGCGTPSLLHRESFPSTAEVLEPKVIAVHALANTTTFGGTWPPASLCPDDLKVFLDTPVPRPVNPSESLAAVIEDLSGKKIIWERLADSDARKPLHGLTQVVYGQYFSPARSATFRELIGVLLQEANIGGNNAPAGIQFEFTNYAIISKRLIVIVSLPSGDAYDLATGEPEEPNWPRPK